jgi:hypothetical protein
MSTTYRAKTKAPTTLLEAMEKSLVAATRYHEGVEDAPVCILWTDADGQWSPLLPQLRDRFPQLLVYGAYHEEQRSGPSIWLKCVLARTIDIGLPAGMIPIIYLPNVSRQLLRAAGDCPVLLQPLVELQYRGTVWTQKNGKDWTVEAFLMSNDSLGLDVARDESTRRSIQAALPVLAETPLSRLEGKHLEAEDFDKLMVSDHPRDLLEWMNDPSATRSRWGDGKWHAFRSRCKKDYGFDPESEGALAAAEKLGLRKEVVWEQLWERFCEAPALYKAVPDLLVRAKPTNELVFDAESWPNENDKAEGRLRTSLLALANVEAGEARAKVLALESEHGIRRTWVWAKLGRSSLALALESLATLAKYTGVPLNGASAEEMARNYADEGHRADLALLRVLAAGKSTQDRTALHTAARALYLPWARSAAETFQKHVAQAPLPGAGQQPLVEAAAGECLLFADGLRFDLGQQLRAMCEERGFRVNLGQRWAGTPTVTATAKPAASPVAPLLTGGSTLPETFSPSVKTSGSELSTARFRKLLEERGHQFLPAFEMGNPTVRGWSECAQIDRRGHDMQIELAGQLNEELERIIERICELLGAGWESVRVVTDHGWLLMPGGLPKCDLPGYLVASRWSRCAAIKGDSKVTVPKVHWHWNPLAEAAVAPDVSAFLAGQEYAHGGLSIQECLIPVLSIRHSKQKQTTEVRVKEVLWQRLRCRVTVEPSIEGLTVDLRTKVTIPESTIAEATKETDSSGQASLLVPEDDNAGMAATIVVLDKNGNVLTKQATTIGEN